jgi:hypothetical protein
MKRTPEIVSRKRQKIGREIQIWKAAIAEAGRGLALDPTARAAMEQRIAFGRLKLAEALKKMRALNRSNKGKREFWPRG